MMHRPHNIRASLAAGTMAAALLAFAAPARAETRTLSLPSYLANPGSVLEVPLVLDNAAGLAGLRVQVNFNPEVLELLVVAPGPLGEAFELSSGTGEGLVQLVFARSTSLAEGGGRLATLTFRVNGGATEGLFSELAIADLDLSDSTGVIDLRQIDSLTATNGGVAVTLSQNIDNADNGLPDWWEAAHALDLFEANAGRDGDLDGMTNLLEYASGGDPAIPDAARRGPLVGTVTLGDQTFLTIGFHRRVGDAALLFRVPESRDLTQWKDLNLPAQMIGPPLDRGDGTEFIGVRGTIPLSGPDAEEQGFLRVTVERK